MQYLSYLIFAKRLNKYMNMIWHDNIGMDAIAFTIEKAQSITHYLSNIRELKQTTAHTRVEPFIYFRAKKFIKPCFCLRIPRLRMLLYERLFVMLQFIELLLRQRISKTESNELQFSILVPMWKMRPMFIDILALIKAQGGEVFDFA